MRLAMPGYFSTSSPMRKKVALTFFSFSTSRILGVQVGSGPSSKVMATFFCEVPPYMSTSYGDAMGFQGTAQNFALPFNVHILAGGNRVQFGRRIGLEWLVPHRPQRAVFRTEPP